jgi:hypothetical protein
MKILVIVLCLVAMSVSLNGCSDYNCRRKARERCSVSYDKKGCLDKLIEKCNCLRDAEAEYQKLWCEDL